MFLILISRFFNTRVVGEVSFRKGHNLSLRRVGRFFTGEIWGDILLLSRGYLECLMRPFDSLQSNVLIFYLIIVRIFLNTLRYEE